MVRFVKVAKNYQTFFSPRHWYHSLQTQRCTLHKFLLFAFTWCTCCLGRFWGLCVVYINTLRPRQDGRHFADDIFKCIFLNENVWIPIKISLKFVSKGPINNIPAMVQIMAWRRPGDKPLSEPMVVNLATHICVARPQWVNRRMPGDVERPKWTYPNHCPLPREQTSLKS